MNNRTNTNKAEYLDDITYIKDVKHSHAGPWNQYDMLLDAGGYGWDYMLSSADYMADADIRNVSEVQTGDLGNRHINVTDSYHEHGDKCSDTPELKHEYGFLSIAGSSEELRAPMKIVWINQTRVLRFFTLMDDELQLIKYAETVIRRSFGTDDAMKLGKGSPAEQSEPDIKTALFIIPVSYEGEAEYTDEPDRELHFGVREAQMAQLGVKLNCRDIPDDFTTAQVAGSRIMHYQTLKSPDGRRFMPLFTSYKNITEIFGSNIRIGVICYETAKEFVLKENLDGIVVSPGSGNKIIPRAQIIKEASFEQKKPDAGALLDDLRLRIKNGSESPQELADLVIDISKMIRRSNESFITDTAHKITEILTDLDKEKYVDLMIILSDELNANTRRDSICSFWLSLIDDYELRMKNELQERSKALRKTAQKMEVKAEFLFFSNKWIEGFIQETEEWVRYIRPLIRAAAVRRTENSFVNESIECLKALVKRSLYSNDTAAYLLTNAFAEYFEEIPSAMEWIRWWNTLAKGHLKLD